MKLNHLILMLALLGLIAGCGGGKQVTRIDTEDVVDLSGRWNDTDSRLVAEEMISDALSRQWLIDHAARTGEKPVVTVGTIRNLTSEHIAMETFIADFERELINAGRVRFIANSAAREEIREERMEQQQFATAETAKKMRAELGADYVLQGAIKIITDTEGKTQVRYYQTDLEMVNLETLEKVWIGTKKIKKGVSQGKWKG